MNIAPHITTAKPTPRASLNEIVNSVLYEGYILYPYRACSFKNQRERSTFGRIYPQAYSKHQASAEPCLLQAECLLEALSAKAAVTVTVGFLQLVHRQVAELIHPVSRLPRNGFPEMRAVPHLEINGRICQTRIEASQRKISVSLNSIPQTRSIPFSFPAAPVVESVQNADGIVVAVLVHQRQELSGLVEIDARRISDQLFKMTVRVHNLSPLAPEGMKRADDVLLSTFASTHVAFQSSHASFVSLLETPANLKPFADNCQNIGCRPILVGDKAGGERNTMLASPIILYDYPKISPHSAGDIFDGAEMDETLPPRVLTLTDAEKRELQVDAFSQRILERAPGFRERWQ